MRRAIDHNIGLEEDKREALLNFVPYLGGVLSYDAVLWDAFGTIIAACLDLG